MKKMLLGVASALVIGVIPVAAFAGTSSAPSVGSQATTSTLVPLSTFAHAIPSVNQKTNNSVKVQPYARGSQGPYYVPNVPPGYAEEFTVTTTAAGGISVGGYFAGGAQIIVVNTANGNEYSGPIVSGTVEALNDYVNCPSGTYDVYIGNPTSSTQSYGPLTVFYN